MLFKIATQNIRRSVRDYAIYFVTLLVAVMVFYAFNSVSDQQVMTELIESKNATLLAFLPALMGLFSFAVALALGFLVIYSNQLLIRRRKHEFGMYFTLGMTPGQVSRIILYETVLVGIVSLLIGIGLGVLLSQLLSFATAAMFGIALPNYQFEFSLNAFLLTLACFVSLYVIVALFNVISIRRCRLINLLKADSRNQKVIIRNPWLCLFLFVVSLVILAFAYWQLFLNGMTFIGDEHFILATVFMLIGSLLFFFSLSGFLIAILTKSKRFYLHKLRPFTTRQIASKVNTSFLSVWVVCVLLFFAITTFGTAMGLVTYFQDDFDRIAPYDYSVISLDSEASRDASERAAESNESSGLEKVDITQTETLLKEAIPDWDNLIGASAHIDVYQLEGTTYGDLFDLIEFDEPSMLDNARKQNVEIVSLSQLNETLALTGNDPIELADDEYVLSNNLDMTADIAHDLIAERIPLTIDGQNLTPQPTILEVQLFTSSSRSNVLKFIVPDEVIEHIKRTQSPTNSYLNIMFASDEVTDDIVESRLKATDIEGITNMISRQQMISQNDSLRVVVVYLALYIGLVLLIATAAVLAVQLLSLTIDSLGRYRMLSKIGCDMRMLRRSLFAQILFYFLFPLGLAICHSAWTINLMSQTLFGWIGGNLLPAIMMAGALILVIYGGYLLVTYFTGKSILKGSTV